MKIVQKQFLYSKLIINLNKNLHNALIDFSIDTKFKIYNFEIYPNDFVHPVVKDILNTFYN